MITPHPDGQSEPGHLILIDQVFLQGEDVMDKE
jgi:hypothetical protein